MQLILHLKCVNESELHLKSKPLSLRKSFTCHLQNIGNRYQIIFGL